MPAGHASRVRALYRRILLLHRVLPPDLKALGDQYMKDEFRRHKTVGSAEAQRFLQEWEAKLGMGTTGEKKVEGSGMLEAPLLEGEFYIPFICDHGKLWQILEGIQLGTFLFKDHWKKVYAAVLWQQANENRQNSTEKACFGTALPEEKLNNFRDEQIGQLQELMQEATKPNRQFSITESKKPKF